MSLIYLVGYRGCGKTTVGKLLAEQLMWAFVDTDAKIESTAGRSVREIFTDSGEAEFRKRETVAIGETCDLQKTVVSLGGGACESPENRKLITSADAKVIWLTGEAKTCFARINGDGNSAEQRPSLTGLDGLQEIEQLLEQRRENYAACADYKVATDELTPEVVANQIANWFKTVDKS